MRIPIAGYGSVNAAGANIVELEETLFGNRQIFPTLPQGRVQSIYSSEYPVYQVSSVVLEQQRMNDSLSLLFSRLAADEALQQTGLSAENLASLRVGACLGSSVESSFNSFEFYQAVRKGEAVPNHLFREVVTESLSDRLLSYYGLNGLSQTVVTACAAGTDAIGIGAEWINNDICDVVFAGGADELNMIPYTGFIRLMIAGKEPCMPFAKGRKGVTLGEGAGIVLLLSSQIAKQFNIRPKGFVLGYGNACDGYHATAPEPNGRGLRKAMAQAWSQSGLAAKDMAFVNAHGTGTQDNDLVESLVYQDLLNGVPVNATKSYTGHALAGVGAVEAVITLSSLNCRQIAKVNFFDEPDEKLGLVPVLQTQNIAADKYAAMSNSLAFGGCNASLVLAGRDYPDGN